MLAVDEHTATVASEVDDAVADHGEVFLGRGAQGSLDVAQVRLRHQAHHRRLRVEQALDLRVVSGGHAGLAGRAEGHEHRVLQTQLGAGSAEKLRVLRHRAGPAAFDEAHAELVEQARHG